MTLRFRKSVKLLPGVRFNLGKKSASVRIGIRGAGHTIGTKGQRVSAGVPGSGVSYSKQIRQASSGNFGAVILGLCIGLGIVLCVIWLAAIMS